MKIAGFLKTSMIDYPDTLACVVYTSKCNFRCDFCHNGDLVTSHQDVIPHELIWSHLEKRKHLIDGVVITGGEPTLQPELIDFIEKVKSYGLKVKLDTNGYQPKVLKSLLERKLLDYVAMDIKNTTEKYDLTASVKIQTHQIKTSMAYLKNSDIDYEFRTTLMKSFHTESDIMAIGEMAKGAKRLVFQQYQYSKKQLVDQDFEFYAMADMERFKAALEATNTIEEITLRGKF